MTIHDPYKKNTYVLSTEDYLLLRKVLRHLKESNEPINLLSYTPAEALRIQADKIEEKERDIKEFETFVMQLNFTKVA